MCRLLPQSIAVTAGLRASFSAMTGHSSGDDMIQYRPYLFKVRDRMSALSKALSFLCRD
jgi:hypothetical protein